MKKNRNKCFNCKKEAIPEHEICQACASNPFLAEKYRKHVAERRRIRAFADTYTSEVFKNFQDINAAESWDFLLKYHRYYEDQNVITKNRVKKIIELIPPEKSARILDIGFGYGHVLLELVSKGYTDLCGIDKSTEAIGYIKDKIPDGLFFVGDCTRIPFEESSVNVILANEVLEHLPCNTTFEFYNEIKRIAARGASVIFSVPLGENLETSTFLCPHGSLVNPNGHVREYTPQILALELEIQGFIPLKVDSIPCYAESRFGKIKNALFRQINLIGPTNYIVKAKIGHNND